MTVCSYFLEGRCRYGDKCWNEHPRGGRNQTSRGGGGSVNRVWVNPSQRSGGGAVQPSTFSRGGEEWGRGTSGPGRDERSSNFSFNTQNRFSALSNTQSGYGRTGGRGGGGEEGDDNAEKQLDVIQKDMEAWQSSGQWLFSCYAVLKASLTGFVELSPEELRMEYYTSRATGDVQSYVNSVQQLVNQWRSRVQELRNMNSHTRVSMVAEIRNPSAQTSSGGGVFSSTASAGFGSTASAGFGSAPSTASTGFGSAPSTTSTGFGSAPSSGFGSSSGFQGGGFGSSVQNSAASFSFSASSAGFGSSGGQSAPSQFGSSGGQSAPSQFGSSGGQSAPSQFGSSGGQSAPSQFGSSGGQSAPSQFGSSAPSASSFSFAHPAGAMATKSSSAGFGPSSATAGGFGGSSAAPGGIAEDRRGGGELYTPLSDLTPDELREFSAKRFTLGQIPLRAPPAELLNV